MAVPRCVMIVFGTRPEAIKMAPVVEAFRAYRDRLTTCVCVTAQHRAMLDDVLSLFDLVPDFDLDVMHDGQDITDLTVGVLTGMRRVLAQVRPDLVLVQGDTTTSFTASLAAFYERIPVGHVEAGLRSGDMDAPWPEEMNRRLGDALSALLFAPTEGARANLLHEGADAASIFVTGNTVIDALLQVSARIDTDAVLSNRLAGQFAFLDPGKRLLLVTAHRRESFGPALERMCLAFQDLAQMEDVQIVYPVHPNPNVQGTVRRILTGVRNVHLLEPLPYLSLVCLLKRAYLVITDSGGIQEEAPSLGKAVLVMRNKTERPEAIQQGTAMLVGTSRETIVAETVRLLRDEQEYRRRSRVCHPFGDGRSAGRIARICVNFLGLSAPDDDNRRCE